MVALSLANILSLLICVHNVRALRKNYARIVTPVNQQTGGMASNQTSSNTNFMFPSGNRPIDSGATTTTTTPQITTPPPIIVTFPPNITIFLNITSGNGVLFPTSPPIITTTTLGTSINSLPSEQTDSTPSPTTPVSPDPESVEIPNGQSGNDSNVVPAQADSTPSPTTPIEIPVSPDPESVEIPNGLNGNDSSVAPEQTDSTPSPTTPTEIPVSPDPESVEIPNGLNGNDSTVVIPDNNLDGPPTASPIIQDKILVEQKCEEYYSTRGRRARKTKVQVFIIGGINSLPNEFPHMAALGYGKGVKNDWLCGGSLISENYVITAAHCVSSKTLGDVQFVRLGTTNLQVESLDSADYTVVRRIPHPEYKQSQQYNDIALLQLDRRVKFSENIAPICLYPLTDLNTKQLVATGWGKTDVAGDVSPDLQKVNLEYFPNNECQRSYAVVSRHDLPRGIVEATQICAGSRKEEKDTCQGDSGGPLQFQDNGRMYLVGITSFGIGCGKPGSPGVYTRVSYFIPWIETIVWGK